MIRCDNCDNWSVVSRPKYRILNCFNRYHFDCIELEKDTAAEIGKLFDTVWRSLADTD
jgi:hypothetical protein